ncbi:hypothetical protein [Halomontanus rarus]|uniref:hypothetical protein n=1 Tax=Halomontanus rarus TaxID=3034020 RepID=UPI0023E86AAD|nr:hypothetical protein [Halovivax sp. TS33]
MSTGLTVEDAIDSTTRTGRPTVEWNGRPDGGREGGENGDRERQRDRVTPATA